MRTKLLDFLRKSQCYNPEKMLSKFPREQLLEERALLLSRINQHTAVGVITFLFLDAAPVSPLFGLVAAVLCLYIAML